MTSVALAEVGKLPAFLRRDLLISLSYRTAFITDSLGLVVQAILFYYVGRLVDPSTLPTYGGAVVGYLEFAAVGIVLGMFLQVGLAQVATAIRGEQLMGTLESLLMTPTAPATIQIGSAVFDLIYVPIRTGIFLTLIAVAFDLHFDVGGLGPAAVVLLCLIPGVWGLGLIAAAAILTFRRSTAAVGLFATLLTLASGAYFPLDLLPSWVADTAAVNPLAVAIEGMRETLLGGAGWERAGSAALRLLPAAAVTLGAGAFAFRLALRRERRHGTVGLY